MILRILHRIRQSVLPCSMRQTDSAGKQSGYDIWEILEAVYRGCKAESEAEHMAD